MFHYLDRTSRRSAGIAVAGLLGASLLPRAAAAVRLQPDASRTPGAVRVSEYDWRSLKAGDVVELTDGRYTGDVTLKFKGVRASPVIIRAAAGHTPVIRGTLTFDGASDIVVENITFADVSGIAIRIGRGAERITVRRATVENCGLGIWLGANAGGGHVIEHNLVSGSKTHGIAIANVNLSPGQEALIADNTIRGNGHHGIELNGSRYIVERNTVYQNGHALPGTSGIHCYADNEKEGTGCYNVIRNNICWGQKDKNGPDGNGIQLDRWCDNNVVIGNICFENDGAGISVYHSANNEISENVLHRNMLDASKSHILRTRGELAVTNDADMKPRVTGMTIQRNVIGARRPEVAALQFDADSIKDAIMKGNQVFHEAQGPILRVGIAEERDFARAMRTFRESAGNIDAAPSFAGSAPRTKEEFRLSGAARR